MGRCRGDMGEIWGRCAGSRAGDLVRVQGRGRLSVIRGRLRGRDRLSIRGGRGDLAAASGLGIGIE